MLNALGAYALLAGLGLTHQQIAAGFAAFKGIKRRMEVVGEVQGITIIDDYGHHPVEISAVLKSARDAYDGRIIAVVQPHRYTRLKNLFEDFCTCFNDADAVIVAPVHAASETPLEGFNRDSLIEGLRARGHRQVTGLDAPDRLADIIGPMTEPGDLVVCLGAGTGTQWAHALPDTLAAWRQAHSRPANDHHVTGGGVP